MKLAYTIVWGILLATTGISQTIQKSPNAVQSFISAPLSGAGYSPAYSGAISSRNSRSVIFTETFGAGLAGDGANGSWTTNGNNGTGVIDPDAIWEYRGLTTTPNNTIGSRGAYSGTQDIIASATSSNGFFIFDSDFLDNAGTPGAFGTGLAATPHESWLKSPSFSTLGSSSVMISASVYCRRYQGDAYFLLSNDGGVTWGDSVTIMDVNLGVNQITANPLIISTNVNYIANQSNVKIALYFDGISNGDGYYFVMVDDIVVEDSPANDLVLGETFMQTTRDTGITRYYTMMPMSQSIHDTVKFSAEVYNNGNLTQTNSKITNFISTPTNSTSPSSSPINLATGVLDTFTIAATNTFGVNGLGLYSSVMVASADSVDEIPFNNSTDSVFVTVTDSVYARDHNAFGNSWYGAGSSFEIGPKFDIFDTVVATSVSIRMGNQSSDGEYFSIYVYDATFNLITSSQFIQYDSANNVGQMVAYDIPDTVLNPGSYIVTYKTYGDELFFTKSDYDGDVQTVFVDPANGGTWFYTLAIPGVRLNISTLTPQCYLTANASQTSQNGATVNVAFSGAQLSYLWSNGDTIQSPTSLIACTTYSVTVTDVNNCVDTSSVTISSLSSNTQNVCYGSTFIYADSTVSNFIVLNESHTSILTGGTAGNCDSIITQNLIVIPVSSAQINVNVCQGTNYTYLDGSTDTNIMANLTHVSTLANLASNGCDSVVTENIVIIYPSTNNVSYNVCFGSSFTYADGTVSNNIQNPESRVSTVTSGAANGCDSLVTENLIPVGKDVIITDVCKGSSFTFYDGTVISNISQIEIHQSIITGAAIGGCDSIIEEVLMLNTVDILVIPNGSNLMANLTNGTYQWIDCVTNTPISGATNRIFSPLVNGIYKAHISDGVCSDTSDCFSVTGLSTNGVFEDLGLSIYPNPLQNELHINIGLNQSILVDIYDNTGKVVISKRVQNQISTIDMSIVSAGVYIVKCSNQEGTHYVKVIKK